jgi:hypothetical protein
MRPPRVAADSFLSQGLDLGQLPLTNKRPVTSMPSDLP